MALKFEGAAIVLEQARQLADERPVRWTASRDDSTGQSKTLEIFDVAKEDQLPLREKLWDLLTWARKNCGLSISLLMHTPEDTSTFYAWISSES